MLFICTKVNFANNENFVVLRIDFCNKNVYNYRKVDILCIKNCKGDDDMLIEYLKENFEVNTPILIENIKYKEYSSSWLFKELNKLCSCGELSRFDRGIYYIPTETILGKSVLCAEDVIERKYISDGKLVYGYYSGIGFMNRIGLTTQMVSRPTIYTNNESTRKRIVKIGYLDAVVKKAQTEVTKENANTLALLELINEMPDWYCSDDEKKSIIAEYITTSDISKSDITKYVSLFPDKTSKKLIESELIYYAS